MSVPVASVIVPCRNVAATVEAAVAGVLASPLRELEVITVNDGSSDGTLETLRALAARDPRVMVLVSEGRGVSAARNAGLAAARGEFIFFLDADDTVEPEFYPKAVEAMRRDNADYCRVAHDENRPHTGQHFNYPLKGNYRFDNQDDIREKYLPCFLGYSFDQVRSWYHGVSLWTRREMAVVWAGGFRAETIRANGIKFDETIEVCEDAMFTCEYLLACRRTTCIDEILYHYCLRPSGSMLSKTSGPEFFGNKLRLLAKRRQLDDASGGQLTHLYAASCVFSLLEILRAAFRLKGGFRLGFRTFFRYGRDPVVRAALRGFPLSWRKPILAASVWISRIIL